MTRAPHLRQVLLLLLAMAADLPAQAPAAAQEQPPAPKGTVLFERHTPAVESTPQEPETPAKTPTDTPGAGAQPGVSSSQRRLRTTLKRRTPQRSATDREPGSTEAVSPASSNADSAAFSSSNGADAPGQTPSLTPEDVAAAEAVTNGERTAVVLAARDLDLHLNTHTAEVEVRARLTVRNRGSQPLGEVPLRISGSLHWESARIAASTAPLAVHQHRLRDDLDHTGLAQEIAVALPSPLAPGETVDLDLYYGGSLASSAQRLVSMGAPAGRAALTDWDVVSDTFTGLRGQGSVLWYPVAGTPALLRNGDAVTAAVASTRAEEAGSRFHLRVTAETSEARPGTAFFCGEPQALVPVAPRPGVDTGTFATAEWTRAALGPHTPSLFLAGDSAQDVDGSLIRPVTENAQTATALRDAAARVRPMLEQWLGAVPAGPLYAVNLEIPGAAGFADGSLLVAPLSTASAASLPSMLVQPLAAVWLPQGIAAPWLREGVPSFLQAVWTERTVGRESALTGLQAGLRTRVAHDVTEPAYSSSESGPVRGTAGLPLATCTDPACARSRAAYVFEMLRGMLGDAALQQALSGWSVALADHPGHTAADETSAMERLLQQVAGKRDLGWFFASWIDADRGLPELQIVTVAPRRVERSAHTDYLPAPRKPVAGPIGAEPVAPTDPRDMGERDANAYAAAHTNDAPAGSWLVAVEVQNNGAADAEVPVTVRAGSLTNTLPLRVPAHNRATIRIPFEADPEEVQVNDGSVPETIPMQHRRSLRSLPDR